MNQLAAGVLIVWALAVVVMSTLGVTGRIRTVTVNGMRRRETGESDAAWAAGLRALYPWVLASAGTLGALAVVVWFWSGESIALAILAGLGVVVVVVCVGIWRMNKAIARVSADEADVAVSE